MILRKSLLMSGKNCTTTLPNHRLDIIPIIFKDKMIPSFRARPGISPMFQEILDHVQNDR